MGDLTAEKTANDASIATLDAGRDAAAKARDSLLVTIGNLVHESVPFNDNEDFNAEVVNTCGELNTTPTERPGLFNHVDLCRMLDIMDTERGTLIAGGRGYFLKNEGVMLDQAMQSMACALLNSRGSTLLQTPFFMKKDMMAQSAQLSDFDEALYKVVEKEGDEDSVKYLIATSEQPLACFHAHESIDTKKFPGADGGGTWRELVSCSNCLDYQSRRLNTRYGSAGGSPNCHMLNSTLTACERTICCLLENYQNLEKGGLDIPEPLRPYLGGRDFLPFKYTINKKDKLVPYDGPGAPAPAEK